MTGRSADSRDPGTRAVTANGGSVRRSPLLQAVPTPVGDQTVLTLVGEIDLSTAGALRGAIADCLYAPPLLSS